MGMPYIELSGIVATLWGFLGENVLILLDDINFILEPTAVEVS